MSRARAFQLLREASEILSGAMPTPSRKTAARLTLGPGVEDREATQILQKAKLRAKSSGSLNDSVLSAAYYAKKSGRPFFGYSGNSFGHAVWRVTDKASDYLDPINNTGGRVYSVTPELVVSWHDVVRPAAK